MNDSARKPKASKSTMGFRHSPIEANLEKIIGLTVIIIILSGVVYNSSVTLSSPAAFDYTIPAHGSYPVDHQLLHNKVQLNSSHGELYYVKSKTPVSTYSSFSREYITGFSTTVLVYSLMEGSTLKIKSLKSASVNLHITISLGSKILAQKWGDDISISLKIEKTEEYLIELNSQAASGTHVDINITLPVYQLDNPIPQVSDTLKDVIVYNPDNITRTIQIVLLPDFSFLTVIIVLPIIVILILALIFYAIIKRSQKVQREFRENTYGANYWEKQYEELLGQKKEE